ncbi:MAG TPA: 50S ribosomal protein L6 [Acidimicrobiia bacterium]|nr:50S ribosomal protein L6 [Acidimicrobiia bacterium]
MSRIGRMPITVPSTVEVTYEPGHVRVQGPKGALERTIPAVIALQRDGDTLVAVRPSDSGEHRSLHGLTRTLVANMVTGVTAGFEKTLEIHGVGYRAIPKPDGIELALGYSHPIRYPAPEGITFELPTPTRVIIRGADKEKVGQVAAEIRALRKPDPYKQKGVRYAGERIRKKAGKASK